MKRLVIGTILALGIAAEAAGQGSLSNQVLRLLSRVNTWSALQTFDAPSGGVVLLSRQSVALSTRTDRLENVGGNLFFNGVALASSSSAGTVTSVAATVPSILTLSGSPITSSGTLTFGLATQSANRILAGPGSGSAAVPTFRTLVDADVPDTVTINCTNCVTWASVNKASSSLGDLATRSATDLTSGTLPNARFPATLPAASGVNLTALNASQLTSGTVPDARFPSTLPALNGSLLTALNATQLTTGALPAGRMPALTGDVTSSAGAVSTTLTNTAVTPSSYGDATHVGTFTVDAKGRLTAAASVAVTFPAVNLASGVSGILPQANGGTGLDTSGALNGQVLIGRTDTGVLTLGTLTGTANQVVVVNSAAAITLSLPQSIATTSTPQFTRLGLGTGAGAVAVVTTTGQVNTGYYNAGNSGVSLAISWNNGMTQRTTLTGNAVIAFNDPIAGVPSYRIDVSQDGTGGRTVTWPATVTWKGGTPPVITATIGHTDVCTFAWTGTVYYGECSQDYF